MSTERSGDEPVTGPVTRMIEREDAVANALRVYEATTRVRQGEAASWARVAGRLPGFRPRPARAWFALAATAVGAVAIVVLFSRPSSSLLDRTGAARPAVGASGPSGQTNIAASTRTVQPTPVGPALILTARPQSLPAGALRIADQARVAVTAGTRALARTVDGLAEIALAGGTVDVQVQAGASGRTRVVAGIYTFVDVGTRFSVARDEAGVALSVSEGTVEVHEASRMVAVVGGPHGAWTSPRTVAAPARVTPAARRWIPTPSSLPARSAAALAGALGRPVGAPADSSASDSALQPSGAPSAAPPSSGAARISPVLGSAPHQAPAVASRPSATQPARGSSCELPPPGVDVTTALACLTDRARGDGLAAQTALYEIARLKRDRLADNAGAIAALQEYQRRFPGGGLHIEVGLSLIDLFPRVGRYREALDDSAALLTANPRLERTDELHLLRGNVYREALHDCAAALREYQLVGRRGTSRVTSDVHFFRAACLDQLGRRDEALAAYRAYLERPEASHADEARRRLKTLSP